MLRRALVWRRCEGEKTNEAVWEGGSRSPGLQLKWQLEGDAAAEGQRLTGPKSRNLFFMQKAIGSRCGKSEKRRDDVRKWPN